MSARDLYVTVDSSFTRNRAARSLLRRHGWAGLGRYVGLLCLLLDEGDHRLDVSGDDEMADVSEALGMGTDELAGFLSDLASSSLIDPGALGEGSISAGIVDEASRCRADLIEKRRAAGVASGEARRKRSRRGQAIDSSIEW